MLLLGAGPADRGVLLALYAADEPGLALAAMAFTFLGDWSTVVAVALAATGWLLFQRDYRSALTLLAATFLGRGLVILQKLYFARLRPEEEMRMVDVHSLSFPSGHAANSMITYLSIALLLAPPDKRTAAAAAAIGLSLLIGCSRPMLGVHWPSDVVAGWAFGLLWVMLVLGVAQTLKRNSSTSPS